MTTTSRPPTSEPVTAARAATVARRHYLEGAAKSEIAAELGVSRFRVARLLHQARTTGLVRIELHHDGDIDLALSVRLASHLGVPRCVVVACAQPDERRVREALGQVAAELLTEIVTPEDVLGLAWSRTSMAMRSALTALAPCAVVQLTGALTRPDVDEGSIELVRDVARIAGGAAYRFYAPMIVDEPDTARSLRTQPEVARAMARFGELTKAVVTIGAWAPGQSTLADTLSPEACERDRRAGARAEVCGIELDGAGATLQTELSGRIIGIDAEQLRATPEIVAIAYGEPKVAAVRAAVHGGYVSTLITHPPLARALLDTP